MTMTTKTMMKMTMKYTMRQEQLDHAEKTFVWCRHYGRQLCYVSAICVTLPWKQDNNIPTWGRSEYRIGKMCIH